MLKLHLIAEIYAPREKVWNTMLEDETYRLWTKPFNQDSHFDGSWEEGSKMRFLGSGKEGQGEMGMVSVIKENRVHEFLSIEHLGQIVNGVEDTESSDVKKWGGALENYTFRDKENGTELLIDMDIDENEQVVMDQAWKESLEILTELAER